MSVYRFKRAAQIHANAQVAGEMCEQLENEGRLTAKNLRDVNRPEDAPLHNEFEWDDWTAAELYREGQARHIINSLEVVREEVEPVRAFFNLKTAAPQYTHIETIMVNAEATQDLFAVARREFEAFERKFKTLEQLAKLFGAGHEVFAKAEE